ncbi:hypothetical protein Xbed_01619 [Xenorhabdus beddingii]|uniref:tRNA_anti-like n=1 Tax=Xenorhabdus beddingii TaxID=40578 RepID=A0A1Y2SPM0_9GAMM|nr:hypothetical protein [Xenorhabdus beddingii]OTA20145.1 hypothetical protein Xbed_01619 [Xenorhabdus beddingii]
MKKVLKWVGIVFVALFVLGLIVGKDENKKGEDKPEGDISVSSNSSSNGKKTISLTEKEAEFINLSIEDYADVAFDGGDALIKPDAIFVTARELQKNYAANEARGDKTYKDKDMIITGIVSSIDSSLGDIPIVTLKTNDMFSSVHVRFKKQYRDIAIDLNKNQKVTFFCKGDGVIIGSPTVSQCAPVDVAKNDFINKQKQYVNKALKGNKDISDNTKELIILAKFVGEQTNDFSSCEKIDKKCLTSIAPTRQKAAKNIGSSPTMQELKELLGKE